MASETMTPNPGSVDAIRLGCLCPVIDNHYGQGMPYPDGPRFWISENCPIHSEVKDAN